MSKALKLYGIEDNSYSNDAEMIGTVHEMSSRIIKSLVFGNERISCVILCIFNASTNRVNA